LDSAGLSAIQIKSPLSMKSPSRQANRRLPSLAAHGFSTTKKPELYSGLSATFYTENHSKSSLDAAPQIYACQPHTVRLLRYCIVNADNIPELLFPACHQLWGQGQALQKGW
jgi:hypothetical protein